MSPSRTVAPPPPPPPSAAARSLAPALQPAIGVAGPSHGASLLSDSTASLPPQHAVYVSTRAAPDPGAYKRGGEAIEDARWRASDMGVLPSRWAVCSAEREEAMDGTSKRGGTVWRAARLVYPCSCSLAPLPRAHALPHPPPALGSLAAATDSSPVPPTPPWSLGSHMSDLDPELGTLDPFEHAWQRGGTWPGARAAHARAAAGAKLDMADAARAAAWKRRRAWWRACCAEGGYGFMWSFVPSTFIRSSPPRLAPLDDAYIPPSPPAAHPFHPDLPAYLASRRRVHWLVPVHGPVVLPGYNDPIVSPAAKPWASAGVLLSSDHTQMRQPAPPPAVPLPRPAPLSWTPALLGAFLDRLGALGAYGPLHIVASGPKPDPWIDLPPPPALTAHEPTSSSRGASANKRASIRHPARPSKPSQLASLAPGAAPSPLPTAKGDEPSPTPGPVRPEAGDHVRVYVDADRALSLRTWLHWLELGPGATAPDEPGAPAVRMFERARLALVGARGEVLVVA